MTLSVPTALLGRLTRRIGTLGLTRSEYLRQLIRREELLGLKPGQALNVRNGAGEWGLGRVIALDIRQGEVCFVVPVEGGEPYWVNPENIGYVYPMHHELNRDIDE
jgi:hypothetical protein